MYKTYCKLMRRLPPPPHPLSPTTSTPSNKNYSVSVFSFVSKAFIFDYIF